MKVQTRNFGEIEIDEEKVITFKEGIPGFEELRKFILMEDEESEFCFLQSIEDGRIVFTVIEPYKIKEDYKPAINEGYFEKLGGGYTEEFTLYNIITIREKLEDTTINLNAPLLIHVERRLGVQAITEDNTYKIRQSLMELIAERS